MHAPRRMLFTLAAVFLPFIGSRSAQAAGPQMSDPKLPTSKLPAPKRRLVGTWKLVDATARDPGGKPGAKPFGPKGMGLVTLTADGRMMAVLVDGRATLPDGAARDYSSYCGTYTFDGTTLVTKVDASGVARIALGSDQVRKVRFEGKRLVLTPPPTTIDGVLLSRDIYWEKISNIAA